MRRIADLYPGEAKTDARDVFIIADAACTMPRTLRDPEPDDETIAALHMLLGFDDDLAAEATRTSNRMRGLLTAIHPHLERVIGPRIRHPAVLDLLERYGSPGAIQSAGLEEITEVLRPGAPRMAGRLAADIVAALQEQTVTVPGANSAAIILPSLAASLRTVLCSNAPSSSPPSPLWPTRHPAPTATGRSPKARDTTKLSSAWPDDALTSCSPCSETQRSTLHPLPIPVDKTGSGPLRPPPRLSRTAP